ncbi:hypothetical protein [Wenjunlia tyrosinilytica]|nr:hypothetical protein [Wenjunlia tyrosinilytica]
MDATRDSGEPGDSGDGGGDDDEWENHVLRRRAAAHAPDSPIYAALVGQWLAMGRAVPGLGSDPVIPEQFSRR